MEKQDLELLEIDLLLEAIYKRYKYDFRNYSKASLRRRIEMRFRKEGLKCASDLIPLVLNDDEFFNKLLLDLSVTVTEMFRDPSFFKFLRDEVVLHLKTYPFVKIWHAGCATGEEVYSMAILLKEEGFLDRTQIYGTDFNSHSLSIAKQGIYDLEKIKESEENYKKSGGKYSLSDYFQAKYKSCKVDELIRKHVTFSYHNLVSDNSFGEMQLIICRNVLIYFDKNLQERVIKLFKNSLDPCGILCFGNNEALPVSDMSMNFETVSKTNRIYKYRSYL